MARRGGGPAGVDHARIGIGVEVVKRERPHPLRVQQRRGALDLSGCDDPAIGDEQGARERQLAREFAEPRQRAITEHDTGAQLKVERAHQAGFLPTR
jgi:hypothetical protein